MERTPSPETLSRHFHPCAHITRTKCLHKTCSSTCHHMSERLLFPCFVFFLCLSCLCPEFQLPCCRDRRALNPMRTSKLRSSAPWRYTTLWVIHPYVMFHFAPRSALNTSTSSHSPASLMFYCLLLRTQTCCPRIHSSTVKVHGRMVLLRNSTAPQVMSP